jgi:hypothetical protein
MQTILRATFRCDYRALTGNTANDADLIVQPPVTSGGAPFTLGVSNFCFLNNDVFTPIVAAPAGQPGAYYENVGVGGPFVASVYGPSTGPLSGRPYKTIYNGWTMGLLGGMGTQNDLLNVGTRKYFYDALSTAFNDVSCLPSGAPVGWVTAKAAARRSST